MIWSIQPTTGSGTISSNGLYSAPPCVTSQQIVTDGKTVTKGYDPLGLVLTTKDEELNTTTFGYDAASQLTSVMDALLQKTQYTYDVAGNKLTQVDANTHSTSYAWDNLNRRT